MQKGLKSALTIFVIIIITLSLFGCIDDVTVFVEGDTGFNIKTGNFSVAPGTMWLHAEERAKSCIEIKDGYEFVEWKGMLRGSNEYTVTVQSHMKIKKEKGYLFAVKAISRKK